MAISAGYHNLADDLREQGEWVTENRVARLAGIAGSAAQIGLNLGIKTDLPPRYVTLQFLGHDLAFVPKKPAAA